MVEYNDDQAKPLAPLSLTTRSDQDQYHDQTKHVHHSRSKLILCCGFIASLILIIAVTFIVLSLTVFHLHNPNLTVDSINLIQPLDFVNTNRKGTVSVPLRNPNSASFRVENATVLFRYGESVVIGESNGTTGNIPEKVLAKQTVKMNLTAEIVTAKLLASVPSLTEDLNGKGVDLRSSLVVNGKLKIIKIFKKSVHLKTNCSVKLTNTSPKLTFLCFRQEHVQT